MEKGGEQSIHLAALLGGRWRTHDPEQAAAMMVTATVVEVTMMLMLMVEVEVVVVVACGHFGSVERRGLSTVRQDKEATLE